MFVLDRSTGRCNPALTKGALSLARRGMFVFPCAPRGKAPLTKRGYLDASADVDQIGAWWSRDPDANIAIATGTKSGIWVLDLDGFEGEVSLAAIEKERGTKLPPTVEVITGGGGRHLYFAMPDFDGAPTIRNSAGQVGEGIDVRGEGGYVIAPPSLHPSGRRYCWSVDSASRFADPPVWLVNLVVPRASVSELDHARPPEHWQRVVHEGAMEGARNHTAASLTGFLLRRGIDAHTTLDLVLGWNACRNRPPLPEAEIHHVVRSIVSRELARLQGLSR